MLLSSTLAQAFDFTENSSEGIPLNFTILATEEGASPQAEISGLGEAAAETIQTLTLPGEITHDGTTYKVTSVGEDALYVYKHKITSVTVGEGIETLKKSALSNYELTTVTLPETLKTIGDYCFAYTKIESIFIPKSVTEIEYSIHGGVSAFSNTKLKKINVASENASYSSYCGILYNKERTRLLACPRCLDGPLEFPPTLENIGNMAFWGNTTIKTVCLPAPLTVGSQAFYYSALETVIIPDSSEPVRFGSGCFWGCRNLKELYIGSGVADISDGGKGAAV